MHTRRTFLWTIGAGLWTLAGGTGWAQTAASVLSPVDVVTQFVAARAAQDYAKAYALLSADTQKSIPYSQFTDIKFFQEAAPHAAEDGVSPLMLAVGAFLMDTHNTAGDTFTMVGPDPADPHTVLVNAQPPFKSTAVKPSFAPPPLLLRVVTVPDAQAIPRIELLQTYQRTSPEDFARMREAARLASSKSNVKQMGLAFLQYEQEHSEHMPDASAWTNAIQPYLGSTNMLHDPSAPEGQQFSYAFNKNLSGISLSSIASPSETVLLFNSTLGMKNAADTGQSLPKPGWHTGGSVVGFADGHVKWVKDGTPLRFTP